MIVVVIVEVVVLETVANVDVFLSFIDVVFGYCCYWWR